MDKKLKIILLWTSKEEIWQNGLKADKIRAV